MSSNLAFITSKPGQSLPDHFGVLLGCGTRYSERLVGHTRLAPLALRTLQFATQTHVRPSLKSVLPKEYARPRMNIAPRPSASPESEATSWDLRPIQDHQSHSGSIDLASAIRPGGRESGLMGSIGRVGETFSAMEHQP